MTTATDPIQRGHQDWCSCCEQRDPTAQRFTIVFGGRYCDTCQNCDPGYFCKKTGEIGWNHPDYVDPFAHIEDEW